MEKETKGPSGLFGKNGGSNREPGVGGVRVGIAARLRQLPGLVELNRVSGEVYVDRNALPKAAKKVVFGRLSAQRVLGNIADGEGSSSPASDAPVLLVVGLSSAKAPSVSRLLAGLQRLACRETLEVSGHADHAAIRAGIEAVRRSGVKLVIAIGGGTVLDVGKAVAALAAQENGEDVAAFQLGRRKVIPEKALPWIAVPTTSGTGSESTDNAVIEIGEEKRSVRGIPAPELIVADPALSDFLPLRPTVIAAVDALAQSLEVLTNQEASEAVQEVALAAFASLAEGIQELKKASGSMISAATRDLLGWGSLLMGLAFAHARLGLPHALVHFCNKFGLAHGNMVGMLLAPGLEFQARDEETARRLARAARLLPAAGDAGAMSLIQWLADSIVVLFSAAEIPASLRNAGVSRKSLEWIAEREAAYRPSYGVPTRMATLEELREVLEKAYFGPL